jgi:Protein of unknown function (DUF3034)
MCNEAESEGGRRSGRAGSHYRCLLRVIWVALVAAGLGTMAASAQTLNWEGQTGIFVTPLAYTAPSSDSGLGKPVVAYHYLDAGQVLGGFHQLSVTVGAFNYLEFGYTRGLHQDGSITGLSNLWSDGFNAFHAKLNLVPEGSQKRSWMPAFSIGFVARTNVRNVGGVIQGKETSNADFYIVATKTVTKVRKLPVVLNLGYKETNASLLGLAGNSVAYQGRAFGAVALALKGPARSTILLASEFLQEPRDLQGLPGAIIPTTLTYAVRLVPAGAFPTRRGWKDENPKLSIDFGVAQAAGNIMPGVNLQARHQFALGVSYGL